MKLNLVNTSEIQVRWVQGNEIALVLLGKRALSSGAVKRKRDEEEEDSLTETDRDRSKLTSDLIQAFGIRLNVFMHLIETRGGRMIIVTLISPFDRSGNGTLENAWDKASVDVEIKYETRERVVEVVSIQGMKFRRAPDQSWICEGGMNFYKTSLGSPTFVHIKISADVSDSDGTLPPDPSCPREIPVFAKRVLEDGLFSDVTITARNGAKVKAHKCFLSACSPVFRAMFQTKTKQSRTGQIDMKDLSEQGVWAFLRFVYHDDVQMPKEDIQVAYELLRVSHMYEIANLETTMISLLLKRQSQDFSVEFAFKTYLFVRKIESSACAGLKMKTIQILKSKLNELEELQEYKDLFVKTPKEAREIFMEFLKSA